MPPESWFWASGSQKYASWKHNYDFGRFGCKSTIHSLFLFVPSDKMLLPCHLYHLMRFYIEDVASCTTGRNSKSVESFNLILKGEYIGRVFKQAVKQVGF